MIDISTVRFPGDTDYLNSLHLRVKKLADKDAVPDKDHVLWIPWSNFRLMLDPKDSDYYQEVMFFTALMAKKIDDYSKDHMLTGDQTVSRILYELDAIKPCAYELIDW